MKVVAIASPIDMTRRVVVINGSRYDLDKLLLLTEFLKPTTVEVDALSEKIDYSKLDPTMVSVADINNPPLVYKENMQVLDGSERVAKAVGSGYAKMQVKLVGFGLLLATRIIGK
jgi:PhoPQ-activated pathogenicity-related protein